MPKQKIQIKESEFEKDFKLALEEIETWTDDEITERINIQLVYEEHQKELLRQAEDLVHAAEQSWEIYCNAKDEYEKDKTDTQKSEAMKDAHHEYLRNKEATDEARKDTDIGAPVVEFEEHYFSDLKKHAIMSEEIDSLKRITSTEDVTKKISELESEIDKLDLVIREQELEILQKAEENAMIQARDEWIEVTSNEVAKAKFNLDQDFWETVDNLQLRKKETSDNKPAFSAKQVALIMYPLAFIEVI